MLTLNSLRKICYPETRALQHGAYWVDYPELKKYQQDLEDLGWTFYVVDQRRGFCRVSDKVITIPMWCVKRATNLNGSKNKTGYDRMIQYILHEISHALDYIAGNHKLGHGDSFMKILISICPAHLLVYEMTYKPKQLVKAGAVFCPDSLNF